MIVKDRVDMSELNLKYAKESLIKKLEEDEDYRYKRLYYWNSIRRCYDEYLKTENYIDYYKNLFRNEDSKIEWVNFYDNESNESKLRFMNVKYAVSIVEHRSIIVDDDFICYTVKLHDYNSLRTDGKMFVNMEEAVECFERYKSMLIGKGFKICDKIADIDILYDNSELGLYVCIKKNGDIKTWGNVLQYDKLHDYYTNEFKCKKYMREVGLDNEDIEFIFKSGFEDYLKWQDSFDCYEFNKEKCCYIRRN